MPQGQDDFTIFQKDENGSTVMVWKYCNLLDLNDIENLQSSINNCLKNQDCTTKVKLIQSVVRIWFHDDKIKNLCKKLVLPMKKRVDLILQAKGGHINY